jgi:hypothetical protein
MRVGGGKNLNVNILHGHILNKIHQSNVINVTRGMKSKTKDTLTTQWRDNKGSNNMWLSPLS